MQVPFAFAKRASHDLPLDALAPTVTARIRRVVAAIVLNMSTSFHMTTRLSARQRVLKMEAGEIKAGRGIQG
jgi:hypothetical protein